MGVADNDNIDDELNECCLQVLEIWTVKCPTELEPSVPAVTRLCLELVKYDPNYLVESGDDESSGSGADSMEEDDEDDDGTDDEE